MAPTDLPRGDGEGGSRRSPADEDRQRPAGGDRQHPATEDPIGSLLPWGHPFRMIDRLVSFVPHREIVTSKQVTLDDPAARGTGSPFLPTALVLEGISQSASLLYQLSYERALGEELPLLGHLRADGAAPVPCGATIRFTVRAVKMTPTMGLFEGVAEVEGRIVGRSELALGVAKPGESPETAR